MGDSYNFGDVAGSVNAGSGSQRKAGRDMIEVRSHTGSAWSTWLPLPVVEDLERLASTVGELQLTAVDRDEADRVLADIREVLSQRRPPNRSRVLGALEQLGVWVKSAGAVAAGGAALGPVVARLTLWARSLG